MENVRQAVIYSSISRYTVKLFGLISSIVVARLLTPAEIGTFAIASAIVMVISEFRLLGAAAYIVREKTITPEKVRSSLGLTFLISWSMGIAIYLTAPYVAGFYELPPIETIFRILSLSFFLAPYISIPSAILSRSFSFKTLFYIKVSGTICAFASTVTLIMMGYSYYALAWGYTIGIMVSCITVLFFWPDMAPAIPRFRGLKPVALLGIYTSVTNLFRKATITIPDMVLGKLGTTTQVGIYSRGLGFVDFLSQSLILGVGPVALPFLSKKRREGGDVEAAYIKASVLLSGLVWPVLAVASIASLPTIRLFFGNQWDAAAPLASWLAIWAALRSVHWFSNMLLPATDNERYMIGKEILVFSFYFCGVIVAFPYGLEGIAVSFVISGFIEMLISTLLLMKTNGLSPFRFFRAWLPTVYVTSACALVTWLTSFWVNFNSDAYWKAILTLLVILPWVWLGSLKISKHILYEEVMGLLIKIIKK